MGSTLRYTNRSEREPGRNPDLADEPFADGADTMPIVVEGVAPLIAVFDMPTSVSFYRDVLGFTIAKQSQRGDDLGWGLLRLDAAELMLNRAYDREERPAAPDPNRIAAHEDMTLYFGCRDVDAAYSHLLAKGID